MKAKEIFKKVLDILGYVLMGVSVLVMLFTIITSVGHNKRDDAKSVFGYRTYTVLTNSMSDTFEAGDMIIVKRVKDPEALEAGDIITFVSQNPDTEGMIITHKIKEKTLVDGNLPAFITYGTTTGDIDDVPVAYNYVLGEYKFKISNAGHFMEFLKSTPGYIVCIFCPFCLLLITQGVSVVRAYKAYKAEEKEESEKEIRAKEDEKKKLEDELAAMKKQLAELAAKQEKIEEDH